MHTLSAEDRGWVAGIIDGEGCIYISRQHKKTNVSPSYVLHVIVSMTDRDAILSLRSITGVGIIYNQKKHKSYYKPQFRWVASNFDAYQMLLAISECLTTKKEQAGVGERFYELGIHKGGRGSTVPQWLTDRREEYKIMLEEMKKEEGQRIPPKVVKEGFRQFSML